MCHRTLRRQVQGKCIFATLVFQIGSGVVNLDSPVSMVTLHGVPSRFGPTVQSQRPLQPRAASQNIPRIARSAQGSRPARARASSSRAPSQSCGVSRSASSSSRAPSRSCVAGSTSSSSRAPSRSCGVAGSASKAPAAGTPEATALIGDVAESDAQHRKRHPIIRSDCPRCQYMKYGPQWEKHYGSYRSEAHGKRSATVWLTPRPARLGGSWGLGCTFCAHWAQQQADRRSAARVAGDVLPKRGRGARDGQTKWARFEIRSLTQVAMRGVSQHAKTLMHRKATRAYFSPEPPWSIIEDQHQMCKLTE